MNCPTCQSPTTSDQQFCRSCGASLTMSAEPQRIQPQALRLATLALIFIGLMIALSGKMWDVRWLMFAGVIAAIAGMFGMAALGLLGGMTPRRPKFPMPAEPLPLEHANPTNKLLPIRANDMIPASVTEGTTDLLLTATPPNKAGSTERS